MSSELYLGLLHGWQELKHLGHPSLFSQALGVGSEVEKLGLELVSMRDASIASCTTTLSNTQTTSVLSITEMGQEVAIRFFGYCGLLDSHSSCFGL